MRIVVEHWKYIFRNLLFVLPFAVAPALFLSLSVDFKAISTIAKEMLSGPFELDFSTIFCAWSMFRTDSFLGIVYSIIALACLIFFSTLLLSYVEKHMRIGKRTFSGILSQLQTQILSFVCFVALYFALYEIWALVLSAVLYMISRISSKTAARILFILVSLLFVAALLYVVTIIYLWLPCKLQTGLKSISALLYSYQLMVGVRWKLYLSFLLSYVPFFLILVSSSLGPDWIARIVAIILYTFCYLSFIVRMETLYFETDKLDREDRLRSYMEL